MSRIYYFTNRSVIGVSTSKIIVRAQRKKLHQLGDGSISWNPVKEKRGKSPGSQAALSSKYDGSFTKGQRRRLLQACEIYFHHCRANGNSRSKKGGNNWLKSSFIDLTIIDQRCLIDSRYGYYKLIKPFLRWLREVKGVTAYVWVYEKQMKKNQQGHWHLLINKYVDHAEMRSYWYQLLKAEGLTTIWEQAHNYIPKPCLDVKGVKGGKMLSNYLGKYFLKGPGKKDDPDNKGNQKSIPSTGRWWGASKWIKEAEPIVLPWCGETINRMNNAVENDEMGYFEKIIVEKDVNREIKTDISGKPKGYTACEIYRLKGKPPEYYLSDWLRKIQRSYMKAYRDCDAGKTHQLKWQHELGLVRAWDGSFQEKTLKNQVTCGLLESNQIYLHSYGKEPSPLVPMDSTSVKNFSVPGIRESLSQRPYSFKNRLQVTNGVEKEGFSLSDFSTFRRKGRKQVTYQNHLEKGLF